jgi:hypothetical protein
MYQSYNILMNTRNLSIAERDKRQNITKLLRGVVCEKLKMKTEQNELSSGPKVHAPARSNEDAQNFYR